MAIKLIPGERDPSFFTVPGTNPMDGPYHCRAEAKAFEALRKSLGLSEREAAKRTGLSVARVEDIEYGAVIPADPTDWLVLLGALDSG